MLQSMYEERNHKRWKNWVIFFFNEDFSQLAHSKILMYLAAEKVDGKTFSYPLSAYLSKTTVKETFVA